MSIMINNKGIFVKFQLSRRYFLSVELMTSVWIQPVAWKMLIDAHNKWDKTAQLSCPLYKFAIAVRDESDI